MRLDNFIIIKIIGFFLESPYKEIYLRKLARELKLSPYAIKKYIDILVREGIVTEEKKANLRYFRANTSNLFFKYLKISFNIKAIIDSSLIDFLENNLPNITSIVLFGSLAKGESTEESDIDLVIIAKRKKLNLGKFEKKLKKEINMHVFSWSEWKKQIKINKAFYYDIVTYGIPLYGEQPEVK